MKKIGIVIFFLQILLCTYSQNIGVLYSNDNITFENDDIEISLNSISIDSTSIESANSAVAIINGEFYDKLHTEPAVIVPCYFFSPQINRVFQIKNNNFDIELEKGSYDILVYNRTGHSIYHRLNISNGKKYSIKYQIGHNSIICRSSSIDTNKYAIKYYGDQSFFYNKTDTICFANSIQDSLYPDSTLPYGFGRLILNVYKNEQYRESLHPKHERVNGKLFAPDLLLVKDLTDDDNSILLPEGYHNLFIVSDHFFSYGFKILIQEGFVYDLNVYMGYSTL